MKKLSKKAIIKQFNYGNDLFTVKQGLLSKVSIRQNPIADIHNLWVSTSPKLRTREELVLWLKDYCLNYMSGYKLMLDQPYNAYLRSNSKQMLISQEEYDQILREVEIAVATLDEIGDKLEAEKNGGVQ